MELLENLYKIAETRLLPEGQDWQNFATEFETAYGAKMALYCPGNNFEEMSLLSADDVISTNSPEMMAQYFKDRIHENRDFLNDPEIPFEPVRRTDSLTDAQLRQLPIFKTFLEPHGIFHIMVNFAMLPDQSFLILFVWRDETQNDFSDMEKLRLAMFMRLLANIIGPSATSQSTPPTPDIQQFGDKHGLTQAEVDILADLLEGKSLKAIASRTNRSYGTVRWHVHNILVKCNVQSQANLLSEFYQLIKH